MEQFELLKRRYDESYANKQRWLALYQDLYRFVIPDRDAFNVVFNFQDQGKPTTQSIYDNTAMLAAYQRANDLHALLMPQDRTWGSFKMDPHLFSQQEIDGNANQVDEINSNIFFYLNESNLSRVVSSSNLDLVGGTGALWVESYSDDCPLYFRSIPAVSIYVEYSTDDVVSTCWYKCKMSGRQITESFPEYRGKQLEVLLGAPNDLQVVIYGQIRMAEHKYHIYAVLEADADHPLWEVEKPYQQIIIYRDRVRPGECDGRGVGIDMLPTIRDINKLVKNHRQYLDWRAFPPLFVDPNVSFNPYNIKQISGAILKRTQIGVNPMAALETPQFPEVFQEIMMIRDEIRKGFMVDPLGEIDSPVKTATEIAARENRAQRTSATDISRLINEQPRQVFETAAMILAERRLLTRDRQNNFKFNSKKLKFNFVSPLYDIQAQSELNHLVQNLQIKQQFFGQGAAMATVDWVKVNKFLTEKFNLKHDLFQKDDFIQALFDSAMNVAKNTPPPQPTPTTTAMPSNAIPDTGVQF